MTLTKTFMTDPTNWRLSADGKYRYLSFLHQPARNDVNMNSGAPFYPPTADASATAPITVYEELCRLASLYRFATLARVTYDVYPPTNWRMFGQTAGIEDPIVSGEYYSRIQPLSVRMFGCDLHEYPNGTLADGTNNLQMDVVKFLGLNNQPVLQPPDTVDYDNSARGSEVFEKLFEDRRVKIFSGMKRKKFVWRPATRFDSWYRKIDLDKVNDAQNTLSDRDDDQRIGGMWLAIDWSHFAAQNNELTASESIASLPYVIKVKFAFLVTGRT